jgi:hypothetical protein
MQIDELVLRLATDSTAFVKGQKEITSSIKTTKEQFKKHGDEVEKSAKSTFALITKLGIAFTGMYTAISAAAAVGDFLRNLARVDTALGLTAANLGISAKELSAYKRAAEAAGVSGDDFTASIQRLVAITKDFQATGKQPPIEAFQGWAKIGSEGGKGLVNLMDAGKDVNKTLDQLHANLAAIAATKGLPYAVALGKAAGIGEGTVDVLAKTDAEYQKLKKDIADLTQLSEADVKAAEKRNAAWEKLKAAATSVGNTFMTNVTPAIVYFDEQMTKALKSGQDNLQHFSGRWDDWLESLKTSGPSILRAFQEAFKNAFAWLEAKFNWIWSAITGHPLFAAEAAEALSGQTGAFGGPGASIGGGATPNAGLGPRGLSGTGPGRSVGPGGGATGPAFGGGETPAVGASQATGGGQLSSAGAARAQQWMNFLTNDPDLHLTREQAKGVVGNFSHESGGFRAYHEAGQPANLGGVGDPQWTGTRRREFEAWARSHSEYGPPQGITAQQQFMKHELLGRESRSLAALRRARTVDEATRVFESTNERAGIVAMGSRLRRAHAAPEPQRTSSFMPYGNAGIGARLAANVSYDHSRSTATTNNSSQQTHIGAVNVTVPNGDANAIVRDLKPALQRSSFAMQGNYSLA